MDISVETAVDRVTVYPNQARVTVVGECTLELGTHRLVVTDLPLTLEAESVRVTGKGTARVRILSVDVTRQFYEETPAERVRDLEQQIEQAQDEFRVLEDDKAGWTAHSKYLVGLREATAEYARGLSRGKTSVQDQTTLVMFLQEQDTQMRTAVREVEQQQRNLKRLLQKLQNELKQLRSARPRQRYQALVDIEVLAAGSFQPEVTYVVRNAGWQPLYDVRLLTKEDSPLLELNYLAQVTQNSGQDWAGVALSVSTARPSLNQRLPELHPWYVDVYTPPPAPQTKQLVRAQAAMPMAAPEAMTEAGAPMDDAFHDVADAEQAAEVSMATVQAEGTAVTFQVGGRADIPSDGSPHKTTLGQFHLNPAVDYLCVPKHTDAIFRRATVNNSGSSPLLAGAASLFVGDEFIGRTRLAYTPVNGEVELLLGVEERITAERELIKRDVDKKMLRDQRRMRYGYKIELKNLLGEEVSVEVHDHIPVARNEQIKVKLDQVSPQPAEQSDLNLLEWHLVMPANSEQTVQYEFLVEYPRSVRITGLYE